MHEQYVLIILPDRTKCYLPQRVIDDHAVSHLKPISLVNSFSQEYEISCEETVVTQETYAISSQESVTFEPIEVEEYIQTEAVETLEMPPMKKTATIEHDDLTEDTDIVSVVSSVVDVSDLEEFPEFDDSDSGYETQPQTSLVTRHLPTYETKVPMTVRSDCTKNAPVIHTLPRNTRVYLLETGIESFPTNRLCHWWRQTFAGMGMDGVVDFIRARNVTGRQLAKFDAQTRLDCGLRFNEHKIVQKALTLAKRKAQVVFTDENGINQRGWISKTKGGKQTISRIFQNVTPTLVIRKMQTQNKELLDCEEVMEEIMQAHNLNYNAIKFGSWFDSFRHGSEYILRRGRRIHGKWRPNSHCLLEFASYTEAAVALKKLANCEELCTCEVDFAKEYANLTEVSFPRY